jgi:hypothetical protein
MAIESTQIPRLSWWQWLFHPIRSYWIMFLVHEALRFRAEAAERRAATNAEKVVANRATEAEQRHLRGTLRRLRRLADKQNAALLAAQRERSRHDALVSRKFTPKVTSHSFVIKPLTVRDAAKMLEEQQATIDDDRKQGGMRHLDSPSKSRRMVAHGLLTVDVAAIFSLFALLFNIDLGAPDPVELVTAGGFSVIAAGVLGVLAHSTGHMAWQWKMTAPVETPAPSRTDGGGARPGKAVLWGKLLGLLAVSLLSGFSILMRVITESKDADLPVVGWAVGLLVGVAAFAAPWLVVIDEWRSGSIEVQTVDALTRMVQGVEDTSDRHQQEAEKKEERAAKLYQRAESAAGAAESKHNARRAMAEEIILQARSYHTDAGRYAVEPTELDGSPQGRNVLAPLFEADISALGRALARLVVLKPEPAPDKSPAEPDDSAGTTNGSGVWPPAGDHTPTH